MSKPSKRNIGDFLPEITLERISPPYPDYPYFEGHDARPFRFWATIFDMQNAWWLIDASTLVYSEEEFVRTKFKDAGLTEVAFFNGPETDTQCYAASNDDFMIVAFRGTEIRRRPGRIDFHNIIADILTDVNVCLVDWEQGGKVHCGFKKAVDEVWGEAGLCNYISEMRNETRTIWFTGHSLGAALATLAADRYGKVHGLYTFGSPMVGTEDFKADFHVSSYRFVNNNDIVARVPPPALNYQHVGELRYIDGNGRVHDNTSLWGGAAASMLGDSHLIFNSKSGQIRRGFGRFIPGCIIDHIPLIYAVHIWNSLPD